MNPYKLASLMCFATAFVLWGWTLSAGNEALKVVTWIVIVFWLIAGFGGIRKR